MPDTLTPLERSARMGRITARDTKPELVVRGLLWRMGYRYRLHARDLPGKPDIIFRGRRLAIFVQGCFWHRHPDPACKLARLPKSRLDFWEGKRHHQAIIALARRRVNVLWAILQTRTPYRADFKEAA